MSERKQWSCCSLFLWFLGAALGWAITFSPLLSKIWGRKEPKKIPNQPKSEGSSVPQPWRTKRVSWRRKSCSQGLWTAPEGSWAEWWHGGKKCRLRIPCQSSLLHFTPLPTCSSRAIPVSIPRAGNCSGDVKAVSQQQLMRAVHHRGFLKSKELSTYFPQCQDAIGQHWAGISVNPSMAQQKSFFFFFFFVK